MINKTLNTTIILVVTLVLIAVAILSFVKFSSPVTSVPPTSDVVSTVSTSTSVQGRDVMITVSDPQPGTLISSPTTIRGIARGTWFFEGSFPISIVDSNGVEIGRGVATSTKSWMTTDFIPFGATISFVAPKKTSTTGSATGRIILKKDNPSGLAENDMSLEVPVTF